MIFLLVFQYESFSLSLFLSLILCRDSIRIFWEKLYFLKKSVLALAGSELID